ERLGRLFHVAEQLLARNAGQTARATFLEAIPQIFVGQLHDNHELAVDDVVAFQREDVRVADGFDAAEGFQFLFGAMTVIAGSAEIAENELDRFEQTAGRFALPDIAEAAAADALNEPVSGNRFGLIFDPDRHESISPLAQGTDEQRMRCRRADSLCETIARKIRNPKSEIRKKPQIQIPKSKTKQRDVLRLSILF